MKLKDIVKEIANESVKESLFNKGDNQEFKQGSLWGLKDRREGRTRDISMKSADWQKGYNKSYKDPRWMRWNAWLTDFLGRMGSSRLR